MNEYEVFLDWRNISPENACERCGGAGVRTYGSTATWRGGVGGQAMTSGVCDQCWGSGTKNPWPSHRRAQQDSVDAGRWRRLNAKRDPFGTEYVVVKRSRSFGDEEQICQSDLARELDAEVREEAKKADG